MPPKTSLFDSIVSVKSVEYRIVPGYPGYRAGDDGSVWGCLNSHGKVGSWHILKKRPDKDGYGVVTLSRDRNRKTRRVSHIILESFVGPRPDGTEACHGPDHNPSNDRPENLRWDTHFNNIGDKIAINSQAKGIGHGMVKLTDADVISLRRIHEEQGLGYKRLGRMFKISPNQAMLIIKRINWKHI